MANCIIGIDPGKMGGIAVLADDICRTYKMPAEVGDLSVLLTHYRDNFDPIVFIEKIQIRNDDMDAPGKVYRIEKMLAGYEQIKTTLSILGIPYVMVHPASWQTKLRIRIKGEEKKDRKRRYKEIAQKWFPKVKATMWNCDALLIAQFGKWALKYDKRWVLANLPKSVKNEVIF